MHWHPVPWQKPGRQLLPASRSQHVQKDKRKQRLGKGQGRSEPRSKQEAPDIQRLVKATAKLALRLADANQVILQDCGFTLFISREEGSILPVMFGVSTEWRRIKEATPEQITRPLYSIMMECVLNPAGGPVGAPSEGGQRSTMDQCGESLVVQEVGTAEQNLGSDGQAAADYDTAAADPGGTYARRQSAGGPSEVSGVTAIDTGNGKPGDG